MSVLATPQSHLLAISTQGLIIPERVTFFLPEIFEPTIQEVGIIVPVEEELILFPISITSSDVTIRANFSNTSSVVSLGKSERQLCGVPGVCQSNVIENCKNITLSQCQDCTSVGSVLFIFSIVCLGLANISGNALIISASAYMSRKNTTSRIYGYKASLAVADLITGFQIFFVSLPNFGWTFNSTMDEIQMQQLLLRNSGAAIAGSTFFLLGFTSSLYHLILLGMSRLYAIKWPFQYRSQSTTSYRAGIIIVWLLAGLVSSVPAWFPDLFDYDYYHITYLYLPSVTVSETSSSTKAAVAMLILLLVIPYFVMTLILFATALVVRFEMQSNRKRVISKRPGRQATFSKEEISAFKTVASMQVGFTLTLVPLGVAIGLFNAGYFECEGLSTPYLVCFYISLTNSLVNIVVYSVREKRFRTAVREMLINWKCSLCRKDSLKLKPSSNDLQPKQVTTSSSVYSSQQL